MGIRHRLAAALVVATGFAAAVSAVNHAAAQDWVIYAPPGVGYTVEFPGTPKVTVKDVSTAAGIAKLNQAAFDGGSTAYLSSYIDYAPSIISSRSTDQHLDAARDGQIRGGRLVSETRIQLSGHPARHVVIEKGGFVIAVRSALVRRRLFQFAYVGRPGSQDGVPAKRFLDSIRIIHQ